MNSIYHISPMLIVGIILAVYLIALCGGALLVGPIRREMFARSYDLLYEDRWTDAERAELEKFVTSAFSFRKGFQLFVAAIGCIPDAILDLYGDPPKEVANLLKDPRTVHIAWRYFVSVLAANPIAAAFTVPTLFVSAIIWICRGFGSGIINVIAERVEQIAFRAATAA